MYTAMDVSSYYYICVRIQGGGMYVCKRMLTYADLCAFRAGVCTYGSGCGLGIR
jgi:hypothetical protein